jgi:hypothetical protein
MGSYSGDGRYLCGEWIGISHVVLCLYESGTKLAAAVLEIAIGAALLISCVSSFLALAFGYSTEAKQLRAGGYLGEWLGGALSGRRALSLGE